MVHAHYAQGSRSTQRGHAEGSRRGHLDFLSVVELLVQRELPRINACALRICEHNHHIYSVCYLQNSVLQVVCVPVGSYIHTYTFIYMCVCIYTYICYLQNSVLQVVCVPVSCREPWIKARMSIYVCIYIHIYMYICVYMYMYICYLQNSVFQVVCVPFGRSND